MKYSTLFLFLVLMIACNRQEGSDQSKSDPDKAINDTIPLTRNQVQSGPVAAFSEKVEDPLNDWKFAVEVYETKSTFDFLIKMTYMAMDVQDTLKIPNFGITPKVEIQKGPKERSCIIGFLDKTGAFKEYKLVEIKNNQLKISTLKYYARTRYKVKK